MLEDGALRSIPPPYADSRSPSPDDGAGGEFHSEEVRPSDGENPPPSVAPRPLRSNSPSRSGAALCMWEKSGSSSLGGLLDVTARSAMNTPR